jgi:hypothetical protein
MPGGDLVIQYKFVLRGGGEQVIRVDLDRTSEEPAESTQSPSPPDWTALGFRKCLNCPLKVEESPRCPAALDLAPTIGAFAKIISHEKAEVVVQMPHRVVGKECQVQDALSSVVALIMATSACPILGKMRGLAYTHLPFASIDETLFRTLGAYLLRQLIEARRGGTPDWELKKLRDYYVELEILNHSFKKRIDAAAEQDATINAVSALGVLSTGVGFSIDDQLADLERLTAAI